MNVKIKDLPINERPRERLVDKGVENLSNEELLAIILKTGTKDTSAKGLASLILSQVENIGDLQNKNYKQLLKIKGIGPSKAAVILACIELGKRINNKVNNIQNLKADNPLVLFEYYSSLLGRKKQEHFYAIYLDNQKRIIEDKLLFIGTINYSLVHPREIFKEAYLLGASAIICIHNHPGGNPLPSKQDIDITNSLIDAGKILGIKVVDHIIICKDKYYSFLENNDICF